MKFHIALIIIFYNFTQLRAQKFEIPIIPDSLIHTSNAIILKNYTEINMIGQGKMFIHVSKEVIIYNVQGNDLGDVILFYNNDTKVNNVKISYFDIFGNLLKKVKKSDFKDYAASGNNTLYSDERVLTYDYTPIKYPFIVSLDYVIKTKNTAFIRPWIPIPNYNVGVLQSRYSFMYPDGFKIKKIEKNLIPFSVLTINSKNRIQYLLSNIPPLHDEPLSPALYELTPYVRVATNKFELAGISGKAETWKEMGKWIYNNLLSGRNFIRSETVEQIQSLVKNVSDPIKRAKVVYEYMQNKTRYINVAIGIGGWQPMQAMEVDQLGYGDCKALTNYTQTLLNVVNVPSYYTIVYAGDYKRDIDDKLVGLQGNHAFLCIPQAKDTIWLECTSQRLPFAYVNSFTDDRKVLIIKPEGSTIVKTKALNPEDNYQLTQAEYQIKPNGKLMGKLDIRSYGTQYKNHLLRFDGLQPKKLRDEIREFIAPLSIEKIEYIKVDNNKEGKFFEEEIHLTGKQYAMINNKGALIFAPNAFNRISYVPKRISNRKYPFIVNRGYKDEDIYTIHLPKPYKVKTLPSDKQIETVYGSYNLQYKMIDDSTFIYHRVIVINQGKYPKDKYKDYRKFRKRIKKLESQKLLFTKEL